MDVFLPQEVWYDWYSHEQVSNGQATIKLSNIQTPLDHVPVC